MASFLLATVFAAFSRLIYLGMHVIPSYPDIRFKHTLRESVDHLVKGNSILVFPEDSASGYMEMPLRYQAGFVMLAEQYIIESGNDIEIVPIFYSETKHVIITGKPVGMTKLMKKKRTRESLAEEFRKATQDLYHLLDDKTSM